MLRLLYGLGRIGWGSCGGSLVYPVAEEHVNSKACEDEISQNAWCRKEPRNEGQDEGDDVENGPDGGVAELDLPEEGELGVDDGVDAEDIGQKQGPADGESRPKQEGQEARPAEDVDKAADEGQDHNEGLNDAIPGPQIPVLVNVDGHPGFLFHRVLVIAIRNQKLGDFK